MNHVRPTGLDAASNSKISSITGSRNQLHSCSTHGLTTVKIKISFTIQAKFRVKFLAYILRTQLPENMIAGISCLAIENAYSTFWW